MSTTISPAHRQRDASIYGRQSPGHQVRSPPESHRRHYALADHARELGFAQVLVIDEDGGRSGPEARSARALARCWRLPLGCWDSLPRPAKPL